MTLALHNSCFFSAVRVDSLNSVNTLASPYQLFVRFILKIYLIFCQHINVNFDSTLISYVPSLFQIFAL